MMIFDSNTVCQRLQFFARNDRKAAAVAFSYRQNKTFEAICLAPAGKFLQREL